MATADDSAEWSTTPIGLIEDMAEVGGWELNVESDELLWTDGTRKIFEVAPDYQPALDEAIEFFDDGDQILLEQLIQDCRETGESYTAEMQIITAEGNTRWVETHGEPRYSDGSITHLRGAIRDITDRKDRDQRLTVLNRILRHNLRNDLNVIGGRAETLHRKLLDVDIPDKLRQGENEEVERVIAEFTQSAESMNHELKMLQRALENVATFPIDNAIKDAKTIANRSESLAEIGTKARHFEEVIAAESVRMPVEVHSILKTAVYDLRREFPEATISLNVDEEISIRGNEVMLTMIFSELGENGIVHNESADPTLEIDVFSINSETLRIVFADNGPGIPEFEQRALEEAEESPLLHGSSIGLWIVNWLVTRLEGSLSIGKSDLGGTKVEIELPQIE